jgi:aconitate hydratase
MGVLPLEFHPGEDAESLDISGDEVFDILGLNDEIQPGDSVRVQAENGEKKLEFDTVVRIDTEREFEYYRNGGILPTVLRQMMNGA